MGIITIKLTVKNPSNIKKVYEDEFLVDTGAHYTVLPAEAVDKLGLKPSWT
jgi:predicted aspartyl protease